MATADPMTTTSKQIRQWRGPVILDHGFRSFFLLAGLWGAAAMILWIAMLSGHAPLPTAFDPVTWHAHEFVFGYVSAVISGFLLTAVPNWTGRLPVVGWPLAGLVALWIAGRVAVALSALMPPPVVALVDLSAILALAAVLTREIIAGRNWRNLPVLGLLAVFVLANAIFHAEASFAGYGLRLGLAAILMLIALIGGRIIPSFTRNWLAQRRATRLPVPPARADAIVLALTGLALASFVAVPDGLATAGLCGLAGPGNLWRLSRWQGWQTGAEPLLWVLHLGYACLGLGFLTVAGAAAGWLPQTGALHVWLAGAVGLMTLAVMTRASLGHTGRPLHAGPAIAATYLGLVLAVVARFAAGFFPGEMPLLHLAALGWIGAFGGFALIFAPILSGPRAGKRAASRAAA